MKLTSFSNESVKTREHLEAMVNEKGMFIPDDLIRVAPSAKDRDEDGTIRNQVLKYFNSNPDLMYLALINFDKVIEEKEKNKTSTATFAANLAKVPGSLTEVDGDESVTCLENFLFSIWPVMDRIAMIARKERTKPRRMIDVGLDNLNIIVVMEYLVEWVNSNNKLEKKLSYSQYQDYMLN